jgi:phosphohistidine phosphatase
MKILSLLRHAAASWDDISLSDFDRPLNRRGEQEAQEMAELLQTQGVHPQLVVSSPAIRAISTAEIIGYTLGGEASTIQQVSSIYEASVNDLMQIVQGLDDQKQHVLLVGHNPGLSLLANALVEKRYSLPTCGFLSLRLDIDQWSELAPGLGKELAFYRSEENER